MTKSNWKHSKLVSSKFFFDCPTIASMDFNSEIYLFVFCFSKSQLEEALKLFEFFRDCKEEESWISEKWKLARTTTLGKDVSQITASIQKHKVSCCAGGAISSYYSKILEHLCPSVQLVQHLEESCLTIHYLKCHDQCLEFLKNRGGIFPQEQKERKKRNMLHSGL